MRETKSRYVVYHSSEWMALADTGWKTLNVEVWSNGEMIARMYYTEPELMRRGG